MWIILIALLIVVWFAGIMATLRWVANTPIAERKYTKFLAVRVALVLSGPLPWIIGFIVLVVWGVSSLTFEYLRHDVPDQAKRVVAKS